MGQNDATLSDLPLQSCCDEESGGSKHEETEMSGWWLMLFETLFLADQRKSDLNVRHAIKWKLPLRIKRGRKFPRTQIFSALFLFVQHEFRANNRAS